MTLFIGSLKPEKKRTRVGDSHNSYIQTSASVARTIQDLNGEEMKGQKWDKQSKKRGGGGGEMRVCRSAGYCGAAGGPWVFVYMCSSIKSINERIGSKPVGIPFLCLHVHMNVHELPKRPENGPTQLLT